MKGFREFVDILNENLEEEHEKLLDEDFKRDKENLEILWNNFISEANRLNFVIDSKEEIHFKRSDATPSQVSNSYVSITPPTLKEQTLEEREEVCKQENDPVTPKELKELEKYLDKVWGMLGMDIGFTRHFLDRVNDPRNKRQITVCELRKLFVDVFKKYGKAIAKRADKDEEIEGILSDISTKVNTPFVLKWDRRDRSFDLVAKTVMRKPNFKSNDPGEPHFKVEEYDPSDDYSDI